MPSPYRTFVWADAGQEMFVLEAAALDGLRFERAGSDSSETASDLARDLDAQRFVDLRSALASSDGIDLIWLAGSAQADRDSMRLIAEGGLPTFACRPQPLSCAETLARTEDFSSAIHFVPLMRHSPGFRAALSALQEFGPVEAVNISFRSGPGCGELFARLYDAMDLVDGLCGPADVLDAAISSTGEDVPETLAHLHGHMSMNMRFPDNRCASIALSDSAGTWFRGLTVLGASGCIRVTDTGSEWIDRGGAIVDTGDDQPPMTPGMLAATQILRIMNNPAEAEGQHSPERNARLLAICEAARLSCRTGQGETPRKLLEMRSRP